MSGPTRRSFEFECEHGKVGVLGAMRQVLVLEQSGGAVFGLRPAGSFIASTRGDP